MPYGKQPSNDVMLLSAAPTSRNGCASEAARFRSAGDPPALLGRSLTSIDMISGGRLIAGLGSGWSPDEFQAVGVPMKQRGARLDECLDVLETMWTENPAEHHGKH